MYTNKKRRLLSLLLAFTMILGLVPAYTFAKDAESEWEVYFYNGEEPVLVKDEGALEMEIPLRLVTDEDGYLLELPEGPSVDEGMEFKGWFAANQFVEGVLLDDANPFDIAEPITEAMLTQDEESGAYVFMLYAGFRAAGSVHTGTEKNVDVLGEMNTLTTFLVTFIIGGEASTVAVVSPAEKVDEPENPEIPPDYRSFLGWFEEGAQEQFDFNQEITSNVTLRAVFGTGYLVSLKDTYGLVVKTYQVAPGVSFSVPDDHGVVGTGKLVYWYDVELGFEAGRFENGTAINSNLMLAPYFAEEVILVFLSEGTQISDVSYAVNEVPEEPDEPTRSGYSFSHWTYYDSLSEEPFDFTQPLAKSTVLKAVWIAGTANYTVIYWLEKPNIIGNPGMDVHNYGLYGTEHFSAESGTAVEALLDSMAMQAIFAAEYGDYWTSNGGQVQGNGSTVINLYFKRIVYTLKFDLNPTHGGKSNKTATMTFRGTTYTHVSGMAPASEYSFTAKLDQNIGDLWPSSYNAVFKRADSNNSNSNVESFNGWGAYLTHRWTLTADLIPGIGTTGTHLATWATVSQYQANYHFERLLGESGGEKQVDDDRYYVLSDEYSQSYSAFTPQLSAKVFGGFEVVNEDDGESDIKDFYYTRNRQEIIINQDEGMTSIGDIKQTSYYNAATSTAHILDYGSVMFGEALSIYKPEEPARMVNGLTYTFKGWYYDAEYKQPVDFTSDTMPDSKIALYAKWESTELKIVYMSKEGEIEPLHIQGASKNEYADLSSEEIYQHNQRVPGRGIFQGWYYYVIPAIAVAFTGETVITKDMVVYAEWKEDGFVIKYDKGLGNGSAPVDVNEYKLGVKALVKAGSELIPMQGEAFVGWKVDGAGVTYYPGNTIEIVDDKKLVAQYANIENVAEITYYPNGGSGVSQVTYVSLYESDITTASDQLFDRAGHIFTGWNTTENGEGEDYDFSSVYSLNEIGIVNKSSVVWLYAQWRVAEYTVTWVNDDGTVIEKDENVPYGTTPSFDGTVPTKASTAEYDYTFANWTPAVADVSGDATYTAVYTETRRNYTVLWVNDDTTVIEKDENVPYGTTPSFDGAVPTKASTAEYDYTFANWTPAVEAVSSDATYTAVYDATQRTYTVTYQPGGHGTFAEQTWDDLKYNDPTPVFVGSTTSSSRYRFIGWSPVVSDTVTEDTIYIAQWLYRSGNNNDDDDDGNDNGGNGSENGSSGESETSSVDIEGKAVPLHEFISTHHAYIIGYPDGTVRPQGNLSRAEAATVFFRLLTDSVRSAYWVQENDFNDVKNGDWFNNAISVMSNMGIVSGYDTGDFKPNGSITRGELATIAANFAKRQDIEAIKTFEFNDISGHWAEESVLYAASIGWLDGYEDGSFRPNNVITRAEFMALVNRMLGRAPESVDDLLIDMISWSDNADTNAWYYLHVQEATNSHEYTEKATLVPGRSFNYETWSEIIEPLDWSLIGSR